MYSGGDDGVLSCTSFDWVGTGPTAWVQEGRMHQPLRKHHDAGVTAILPMCPYETAEATAVLLTGSYDEHVRVIDVGARKVLAEASLGGGVWATKISHYALDS